MRQRKRTETVRTVTDGKTGTDATELSQTIKGDIVSWVVFVFEWAGITKDVLLSDDTRLVFSVEGGKCVNFKRERPIFGFIQIGNTYRTLNSYSINLGVNKPCLIDSTTTHSISTA